MPFLAPVRVTLKPAVNDPRGSPSRALKSLCFEGVSGVRVRKYLKVQLSEDDQGAAEARVREMCQKLLANPVTETFSLELVRV